jgi:tRNA 2-selenouridine synthase
MPVQRIDIDRFFELYPSLPVLDVRSPGEYTQAHIPGAYNLPLFNDEERKVVGTTYKQQSREDAIKIGLDFFGPKMRKVVENTESILSSKKGKEIIVHCWRGGMRSAAIAWLLDLYGFKVYTLLGGYKVFRRRVLDSFSQPYRFRILGGYTGSGKTYVIETLEKKGECVINLEKLANHKGSAFGAIGMPPQPSQEMFENLLAIELLQKKNQNIWLEDESQRLGLVNIPQPLWLTMRQSPVFFLDIPFEERLQHLITEYGSLDKERMIAAILRIKKRLGGLETKTAINHLVEDDIKNSFAVLLKYYDKQYAKGLHNRENLAALLNLISCTTVDAGKNAQQLIHSLALEKFA